MNYIHKCNTLYLVYGNTGCGFSSLGIWNSIEEEGEVFQRIHHYLKIWAHLDNFYFHCFIRVEKFKKTILCRDFQFFPFVPPWNNENKNCLNELKFWEASEDHKSSICWKFQLSILWNLEICQDAPNLGQDDLVLSTQETDWFLWRWSNVTVQKDSNDPPSKIFSKLGQ